MNYYPLALALVMAFAGGWVLRGVFDLWRHPQAKVYGATGVVSGANGGNITIAWSAPEGTTTAVSVGEGDYREALGLPPRPQRLRAVE